MRTISKLKARRESPPKNTSPTPDAQPDKSANVAHTLARILDAYRAQPPEMVGPLRQAISRVIKNVDRAETDYWARLARRVLKREQKSWRRVIRAEGARKLPIRTLPARPQTRPIPNWREWYARQANAGITVLTPGHPDY
jgi:hypothetical protein